MMIYVDADLYDFDDADIVEHVLRHPSMVDSILEAKDYMISCEQVPEILEKLKRDNVFDYERMIETLRYKELI